MNVLAICADTFRADYLGCYDNVWIKTPNLDFLAENGIIFRQAYAEALPTLPARRIYLTGRKLFPRWQIIPHKGDHLSFQPAWHGIPEEEVTIAEILSEAGIECGFITDVYHYFKPTGNFHRSFHSWEFIRGQEGDAYRRRSANALAPWATEGQKDLELSSLPTGQRQYLMNVSHRHQEEEYFAPKVMLAAAHWLEHNADNQPFFLWVDCFDPHEPWDPPDYYADAYYSEYHDPRLIFAPRARVEEFSEGEMERIKALYAGEVTMVDFWIGNLLRRLEGLNLAQNTAIIFTSDHGTLLGEMDTIHKQPWALIQPETRLPLILRLPDGHMSGMRIDEYVSSYDIAPTILSLLDQPVPEFMEGQDLVKVAKDNQSMRNSVVSAYGPYASIRTKTHNYIAPYRSLSNTRWERNMQPPRLFALDEKLCESQEVLEQQRDIAEQLQERINEMLEDYGEGT
jgi:arylsulfatase A-like enzyme